jgi:hypothetical protein
MLGMTRATATLLGAAVAGLLIWLATQINDKTTGGYWAAYGVVAGAGLVLALSQLASRWKRGGRPTISPAMLGIAFLPVLVAVGWVVLFHQPHPNWFRGHIRSWTGDIGIGSLVTDLGEMLYLLSFGVGLVLGFCFDTAGVRAAAPGVPLDARATDEPLTPDREVVESRPRSREPLATTPAGREPEVEAPPRQGPPA